MLKRRICWPQWGPGLVTVTDFLGTDYVAMLAATGLTCRPGTIVVADGPVSGGAVAWDAFVARATDVSLAEAARRRDGLGSEDLSDISSLRERRAHPRASS